MLNAPAFQPGGGMPPPAAAPPARGRGPPPLQQGAPLLQPPGGPNVVGGNYRSYFLDASKDPYNGSYGGMMTEFNVDVQVPPPFTPNQLANRVHQAGDQDTNMAFAMLC
jgi:hypothetical protein